MGQARGRRNRWQKSGLVFKESGDGLKLPNQARLLTDGGKPIARPGGRATGQTSSAYTGLPTAETYPPSRLSTLKPPHKLDIVTGLESEIQPERDVISKDGDGFLFASRSLAAAIVTQLFSYMIGKDIRYGYACTGEVFVFLHIPDDPAIVYYSVCVPNLGVLDDNENRLHRTAVAQVIRFCPPGPPCGTAVAIMAR